MVHFLYTGNYQTIDSPPDSPFELYVSFNEREFQRSVYVYLAARNCHLSGLITLACERIVEYSTEIPMLEVLRWTAEIFPKLPKNEVWLQTFVGTMLRRSAKQGDWNLDFDDMSKMLAKNHSFFKAISNHMFEIIWTGPLDIWNYLEPSAAMNWPKFSACSPSSGVLPVKSVQLLNQMPLRNILRPTGLQISKRARIRPCQTWQRLLATEKKPQQEQKGEEGRDFNVAGFGHSFVLRVWLWSPHVTYEQSKMSLVSRALEFGSYLYHNGYSTFYRDLDTIAASPQLFQGHSFIYVKT